MRSCWSYIFLAVVSKLFLLAGMCCERWPAVILRCQVVRLSLSGRVDSPLPERRKALEVSKGQHLLGFDGVPKWSQKALLCYLYWQRTKGLKTLRQLIKPECSYILAKENRCGFCWTMYRINLGVLLKMTNADQQHMCQLSMGHCMGFSLAFLLPYEPNNLGLFYPRVLDNMAF